MQVGITGPEIALRVALTFLAGAVLGINRGEHGRPAGLRTTVLVCLTASASLILANLLLGTTGKTPDSFVAMDVMRLPLGILTGMGFIGAGTILHKGNLVVGVTTAATLWFATIMGFCFGSGEISFGLVLLGLGVFVLWGLKWAETRWKQRREAILSILITPEGPSMDELAGLAVSCGYKLSSLSVKYTDEGEACNYQVHWHASAQQSERPLFLAQLAARPGVRRLEWTAVLKS